MRGIGWMLLGLALSGCSGTLDKPDTGFTLADTAEVLDWCAEQAQEEWAWSSMEDINRGYCAGCHSIEVQGEDRQGAPEWLTLDTPDDYREHGQAILDSVISYEMPPDAGMLPVHHAYLIGYVRCTL